jgi:hypothetical protein
MADDAFEARLDHLFRNFSSRGLRPFDPYVIADATIASRPRKLIVSPLSRLGLVLVGLLLLLGGRGVALGPGEPLTSPPTVVDDLSSGLLVLVDAPAGTIQVFKPNGGVVAAMPGSTNGCDRLVMTPDGQRVAWVFAHPPVHIVSLDGQDQIAVPQGPTSGGWAFSPDRTRVAYLAPAAGATYALTIASLLDGSETVVARGLLGVQISPAAWSVADTLALSVTTSTAVGVDLISADGSNLRPLLRLPVVPGLSGIGWMVSWSPDGSRLAYARDNGLSDPTDAAVIDLATGRSTAITTAAGQSVNPWTIVANTPRFLWTPDGREVAFMADGRWMFLDVETHEARVAPGADRPATYQPFWSPDAAHVAFLDLGDPTRLAVLAADLSDRVDLVADGPLRGVAWAPDSRHIAVVVGTSLELLDPTGAEPPTRIVSGARIGDGCLTWWSVDRR